MSSIDVRFASLCLIKAIIALRSTGLYTTEKLLMRKNPLEHVVLLCLQLPEFTTLVPIQETVLFPQIAVRRLVGKCPSRMLV